MIGESRVLRPAGPDCPRLVLVHGLEDSWASWRGLAAVTDPRWRVTALDLPWRSGNDYRWRRSAAADWLARALDELGEPVDVLVAHSFGANAAMDLMAAGNNAVGPAAVLICPLYRPPGAATTWRTLDRARTNFERHVRDGVLARLGERAAGIGPDVLEVMMVKALDRVGPMGLLTVFERYVASADLALEAIGQRIMVLGGAHDPTLSTEAAHLLGARIPTATVRVDVHFDHFCHIREPVNVHAHVDAFLQEVIVTMQSSVTGAASRGGAA
ncbi:alpha/beta fold hydrolase [Plantactinospora sp. WMMC1484]|uniref:alpha/beta fold hydrolase n=1 Tax=Plantactinospora sp. WMMC1484 TaxID=3404122 RepID=UPI003BF59108